MSRKEISISAFFANGCSPITFAVPENGFVVNQASNNLLPITMTDYTYANLDEVVVEYAKVETSNWIDAVTIPKAQVQNGTFGTQISLNVAFISDGEYSFRLKLKCGLDDVYSLGDEISQSFNETLGCVALNGTNFSLASI